MNPASLDAIADFTQTGGRVVKLQETIPATAPEVLDYLVTSGVSANYCPGNLRLYRCNGKVLGLSKLIKVANERRRIEQLPLFVARIAPFRR
jgi:hypothetical protein